tara:strand:- start:6024 stop:6413 length:390 start_codon:yes stop_codon:yes gene_type:complete
MKPLEKIIIAVSKPFDAPKSVLDPATNCHYSDYETITGKLMFIGDKKKYNRFKDFMKKNEQWDMIDEIYIYDRYHKNGNDMVESVIQRKHEFSCDINLKKEYEQCWFNKKVSGCKLWPEYALDPYNKRF